MIHPNIRTPGKFKIEGRTLTKGRLDFPHGCVDDRLAAAYTEALVSERQHGWTTILSV